MPNSFGYQESAREFNFKRGNNGGISSMNQGLIQKKGRRANQGRDRRRPACESMASTVFAKLGSGVLSVYHVLDGLSRKYRDEPA